MTVPSCPEIEQTEDRNLIQRWDSGGRGLAERPRCRSAADGSGATLRILYVEPVADSRGHEGEYTAHVCEELARLGHEVVLCTNRFHAERYLPESPSFEVLEAARGRYVFEDISAESGRSPIRFALRFVRNSLVVMREALRLAQQRPFDVMYIIDTDRNVMSLLLRAHRARGRRLPAVVVEIHAANFSPGELQGGMAKRSWKRLQRRLLKGAIGREIRAVHVLGEYHAEALRAQLSVPAEVPVVPVTEGVAIPPHIDSNAARERLGLPVDETLLLMFGNIRHDKGAPVLLDALARIPAVVPFRLVLVGNPVDHSEDELMGVIRERRLEDRVIARLGYASEGDMFLYFQAADAAVFPYRAFYTGGAGPLRKACACGVPVIATNVSEMGQLVQRRALGIVVPADDPAALAAGLTAFVELPAAERAALAANTRAFAEENTWSAMAGSLAELFRRVAAA
jgi:glycosyltransferase involved in cell wall biosynthesis